MQYCIWELRSALGRCRDVNRPGGVRGTCHFADIQKYRRHNANVLEDLEVFRMHPLTVARMMATYNPSSTEASVPQLYGINED